MLRHFTILLLGVVTLWTSNAYAVPGLDRYQTDLGQKMETVLRGASLADAFGFPVPTPKAAWENGLKAGIQRVEPVTATVAALALNWTFYKGNRPIYIAQVVVLATAAGPRLMRLERTWTLNSAAAPPTQGLGLAPNKWPDVFQPWAMVLAAFHKSAGPESCPQLPIAGVDALQSIPKPYRDMQRKTIKALTRSAMNYATQPTRPIPSP